MFEKTRYILSQILGNPKRSAVGHDGWIEYNCPSCKDNNMGMWDNKHNLAVRLAENEDAYCHCWKCGFSGNIYTLVKKYGTKEQASEVYGELKSLAEKGLYTFKERSKHSIANEKNDIELPENFKTFDNCNDQRAIDYLISRGLHLPAINRFGIGYVGSEWVGDYRMRNRIIFPSFDKNHNINYWVGRDYTGTNTYKMRNSTIEKNSIVFNEWYVNWYEPVTIVEGPFDHIVVPNSIPLLGKSIKKESAVYAAVMSKCMSSVNILLDNDASEDALKLYILLNNGRLKGRVRICEYPNIDGGESYDPSEYYQMYGTQGILSLLRSAHTVSEFEILMRKW